MTAEGKLDLGRFAVTTDPAVVDAFRRATGRDDDGKVPLTFPMRWLALPDVRTAVLRLLPETDIVPVHESQSFECAEPLVVGRSYSMSLEGRRETGPDRLVLDAVVSNEAGDSVVHLETMLRLISTRAAAA